jgi:hypothetical protein
VKSGTDEKVGFIVNGKIEVATNAKPGSTISEDNTRSGVPEGAQAVVHGHIERNPKGQPSDGLIDSTKSALGDSQPLTLPNPLPNVSEFKGKKGVNEIENGRLQYRMIEGEMSQHEAAERQKNLNNQQQSFDLPIQVPMPDPIQE